MAVAGGSDNGDSQIWRNNEGAKGAEAMVA